MIIINKTKSFDKKFSKLSEQQKQDFYNCIKLFYQDIFHKSLRIHKLKGKLGNFYSFSLNYKDRCVFCFVGKDEILLCDIGDHDVYN